MDAVKLDALPTQWLDALSLEYKLEEGCAVRDLDISDVVNNPVGAGVCSIFSLRFKEQPSDLPLSEASPSGDNITDSFLVLK